MNNRSVLVTGASTGIGKACALRLEQEGFSVVATVRSQSDADKLKAESSERVHPILLDVTDQAAITEAVKEIGKYAGNQLYGLVNNAGIATSGPLECVSINSIRQVLEVNVIGLMAVTQAFLPLLKPARGRIVNIGSASGVVASPLMSMYAASKFAVQAVSDSWRLEFKPFGISVSLIAPGKIQSDIWGKARSHAHQMRQSMDPKVLEPYQPFLTYYEKLISTTGFKSAQEVSKAVLHALTAKKPRQRYIVGKDAAAAAMIARLPVGIRDWLMAKAFGV